MATDEPLERLETRVSQLRDALRAADERAARAEARTAAAVEDARRARLELAAVVVARDALRKVIVDFNVGQIHRKDDHADANRTP